MSSSEYTSCHGGVTAALGFGAAGIHCGVKKAKKDLALIVSSVPATTAGVFTLNTVAAAPVVFDRDVLRKSETTRVLVCNSGNANACTGDRGMHDALAMAEAAAKALHCNVDEVLVSSTGVIGQFLPIEKITTGITEAAKQINAAHHTAAAEAIMTTDTFAKEYAVRCDIGGKTVTIGGMAKGSGMIAPNMATMLAFVTTDMAIDRSLLHAALLRSTDRSFNRISVDGDTSTNDMVSVMANGKAGNVPPSSQQDPSYVAFQRALEQVLVALAKMIVVDGEGATKFIEINVSGAANEEEATKAARTIANSSLVKTAIHGEDANWGRILCAVGYSGISFVPEKVGISFGTLPILRPNYVIDFSEAEAKKVLEQKEITINVALNGGNGAASFWTCDLTKDYITINASYRT